jgi:hypothetical protein
MASCSPLCGGCVLLIRRRARQTREREGCQLTLRPAASQCWLRSSRFRTFPAADMGSASAKATLRGSLYPAIWPRILG